MVNYYDEPLADELGLEYAKSDTGDVYDNEEEEEGDDEEEDEKDAPMDSFKENMKISKKGIDLLNDGATSFLSGQKEANEKKKKEALSALVKEVPILEAKIDAQTKLVDNLKIQSNELLNALKHNYNVIQDIDKDVVSQNKVIENNFINIENKLNLVLSRIEQAKQVLIQHISNVETEIINEHQNQPKQKTIKLLSHAFDTIIGRAQEFKKFTIDEKVANFDTNDDEPNSLDEWEQTRIPQLKDGIYNSLWDIINEDWAIPKDRDDQLSFITLNVLCYAMYFYAYILHYLMEQYSQLLEYYRYNTDLDSYNRCYWNKLNTLNDFSSTLIGSNGFFLRVERVLTRVKNMDFIQIYRQDIHLFATENIENLAKYKNLLSRLRSSFMNSAPRILDPDLDFSNSNTTTVENTNCIDTEFWTKGSRVRYAIQLLSYNMTTSSLISKWSPGYTLQGKANPIVKVYLDRLNRTRVIFRRFEGESISKSKIVAILKDPNQRQFRDIDRDLYDFASQPNPTISLTKVKFYLEHGANVNALLEHHQVALHGAAQHRDHWKVAAELIKNGANINVQDVDGYTPLFIAAERGHHEFVTKLLEHKANTTLTSSEKYHQLTPLHIAVFKGHTNIVQDLLKAHGIDLNARSIEGFTALHFATAFDYEDIVSILLEDSRTEIDPKSYVRVAVPAYIKLIKSLDRIASILATSAKVTPLHLAYAVGNEKVVSLLLAKGADLNARTSDGSTVMHFAAINDNVNLIPDCSNSTIFNSPNVYDITPLYVALKHNNTAVADKFIKQCADTYVRLSNQRTMLHIAVQAGDANVVKKLLNYNSNLKNVMDSDDYFAEHYAIVLGNLTVVEAFLNHLTNVHARNSVTNDPIVYSIIPILNKIDASKMIELFTQYDLDVNIVDENKNTLLHLACAFGYEASVDVLLKHPSINVDAANENNETPFHLALKVGNVRIANSLFNKGANLTLTGHGKWTAVNYAITGKLTGEQTVSFIEKFMPISDECGNESMDKFSTIVLTNIPQASEYNKLEVIKFYLEKCHNRQINFFVNTNNKLLHKIISSGNAEVYKYIYLQYLNNNPDYNIYMNNFLSNYSLERLCNDAVGGEIPRVGNTSLKQIGNCEYNMDENLIDFRQTYVIDSLRGNMNFEILQILNSLNCTLVADDLVQEKYPNNTNWNALNYTIMGTGDYKIIRLLLENAKGVIKLSELRAPYDENENLMHLAAKANKSDIAKYLFEKGVKDVNAVDKDGFKPIHYASRNGDLKMVKFLVENGAKDHIGDIVDYTWRPIKLAIWNNGNVDLIRYLIENGASEEDYHGYTCIQGAAYLDKPYIAIYLCENTNKDWYCIDGNSIGATALHFSASNNNINLAEYFFTRHIEPNVIDNSGISPVYYAIRDRGQLKMIQFLHSKNASITTMLNTTTADNFISLAISKGKYDIAQYLIKHGANIKTPGKSGNAPLHEAVLADESGLIQMLIKKGASCFDKDGNGKTPIDLIFKNKKDNALKFFMLNYQDKQNGSLMHERTLADDSDGVQWLVQRGGNVNSLDKDKNSALHLAAEKGYKDVVIELIKSNCLIYSTKNEKGQTALDVAKANHHEDIVDILKNRQFSRKRRQIEESMSMSSVTSSAGRSSGLINCIIESFVSVFKAVPAQLSNLVSLKLDNPNARSSMPHSGFKSFESPDLNSSLLILDLIIRKNSGQPYVDTTLVQSVTPLEARMFALSLVEQMQSALDQLAEKSVQNQVELDWFDLYRTVEGLTLSGQYEQIESLMHSTARKALPSEAIDSRLLVEMVEGVLNQMTTGQTRETQLASLHSFSSEIAAKTGSQVRSQLDGKHYLN